MSCRVHIGRLIAPVLIVRAMESIAADSPLPDPLRLVNATTIAVASRAEVSAANARAEALAQRPAIVSALEDPTVSAAIDHYPYRNPMMESGRRFDQSIAIEQKFPLSRVRTHRHDAARADAARARSLAAVTGLDVGLDAQRNFLMLHERRRMKLVIDEQVSLARQLVSAAANRYASGAGVQADILRAEVEVARLRAEQQAIDAQIRAAEAMLNVSLGRSAQAPIPALQYQPNRDEPASVTDLLVRAKASRPELGAGAAEMDRAAAEVEVMRTMYKPMAMVRIGQATTMAEGAGAMLMIGVTVPLWRDRLDAGVSEAQSMQRMAAADLESMRSMVSGEVIGAREKVLAARAQLHAVEFEVLPRAVVATDSALAGYAAGRSTLVAVIESARALWSLQAELVMLESSIGEAWARLDRAVGAGQASGQ